MRAMLLILASAAFGLGTPAAIHAQETGSRVKITEERPGLMARAKVPSDSAIALARRAVPNGRITKAELEEEDGVLIFSFDLSVPGEPGVYEVHVNAVTGKVGPVEHETPEQRDGPESERGNQPSGR